MVAVLRVGTRGRYVLADKLAQSGFGTPTNRMHSAIRAGLRADRTRDKNLP